MEGLFCLICMFNYSFGLILTYLLKGNQSNILRILAIFVLVFSVVEYQSSLKCDEQYPKPYFNKCLLIAVGILAWMGIIYFMHGYLPECMRMYILAFPTRVLSMIFLAYAFIRKHLLDKISKWINPFAYFYTLTLLYIVLTNVSVNTRTLGIDRQVLSYAGAYAFMLLLYVNMNFYGISKFEFFSSKYIIWINYLMIAIDLYIVFAGGGRGAFVLVEIGMAYFLLKNLSTLNMKKIISSALIIVVGVIIINIASTSTYTMSGFFSIQSLFENGFVDQSSMDRLELYTTAWGYAKESWFLGNGAGSTAYTVGFYSHNIFIDILVEYGFWGIIIIAVMIIKFWLKVIRYNKLDTQIDYIAIIFICSFTMLLFSGSMYSESAIWFSFISMLLLDENEYCERRIGE